MGVPSFSVARDSRAPLALSWMLFIGLFPDGHQTREVAAELCYSERTIKNVLHDVVIKMNVRTRSQAVAQAVRQGMI